jgi:putative membrane protein
VISAIVSAVHVLALALGLPSIFVRGRALKGTLGTDSLARLFAADSLWGIAAVLWLATGLLRVFGGLEKGSQFYLTSRLFWIKMALFAIVILLEIWPMVTFMRWRSMSRRGGRPDTTHVRALFILNHIELALVVVMVFVASFMARGFGHG